MTAATIIDRPGVTFGAVLRSEGLKLGSLRSTYWAAGLTVVFTVLLSSGLILATAVAPADVERDARAIIIDQAGENPSVSTLAFGYTFAQYVVAVLGVLIISTERGSGLLNMTLAAVPQRTPVYLAKITLSFAMGFLLGLVSSLLAFFSAQPVLGSLGLGASITDLQVLQVIFGGSLYLGLISVLSTALGSLFRSTASGAGLMLGLLLFAPGLAGLIPVIGQFLAGILPTAAGRMVYQPVDVVGWPPLLAGALILLGWAAAAAVTAGLLFKKRDVS